MAQFKEQELKEELLSYAFEPSVLLLINVGANKYGSTFRQKVGYKLVPVADVEQAMIDLPATIRDCEQAGELFEKYGAKLDFKGPGEVDFLLIDPTWKHTTKLQTSIRKYLN